MAQPKTQDKLGSVLARIRAAARKVGLDGDKLDAALLVATKRGVLPPLKRLPKDVARRACALLPNAGDAAILVRLKSGGVRVYDRSSHRALVEAGRKVGTLHGWGRNARAKAKAAGGQP